jgi:DNA repair protein RadC
MTNVINEIEVSYKPTFYGNPQIKNSREVKEIFQQNWDNEIAFVESFYIMLLSRKNQIIGVKKMSQGSVTGTVTPIREILAIALKCNAVGIITCHNHPSGNLTPSPADKNVWTKLRTGAKIMEIENIDNLIISPDGRYYSEIDN